jgi:hypothetical protein
MNNNSDTQTVIQWTVADPDAPVLGIGSRVCNLALEIDKEWYVEPVGERWHGGRRAYWTKTPKGIDGHHRCGTDQDFEQGGTYDDESDPPKYGSLGWPLCCDPPRKISGGAGGGGRVSVRVRRRIRIYGGAGGSGQCVVQNRFIDPTSGGLAIGGQSGDRSVGTDATSGGLAIGGQSGDVFQGVYLSDTFSSNPGTLAGRPVESGIATPTPWVVINGTWIAGSPGQALCTSVGTVDAKAIAEATVSDGTAIITVGPAAAGVGKLGGMVYRFVDTNNYWAYYQEYDGGSVYNVWVTRFVGGVQTNLYSHPSGSSTVNLKVVLSGPSQQIWLNGTLLTTITDSALVSATKYGVFSYTASGYLSLPLSVFQVSKP